jgi:ABC-type ATPase with predicted acetyltransferase domain
LGIRQIDYIKLNDGNTIVYGHLQSFTPEIDRFVYNQQINQRRYYQEIEFKPGQYPVRKGDVVAISGQSGVGYPHLHMEIRDKDNIPINPQKSYYYLPDKTSPIVVKLAIKRFLEYGINNYHDLEFLPVVGRTAIIASSIPWLSMVRPLLP